MTSDHRKPKHKIMKNIYTLLLALFLVTSFTPCDEVGKQHITTTLRTPAYPLITIDTYTSAWSATDNLYDGPIRHWTGKVHSLIGAVRVDGDVYRFLGKKRSLFRQWFRLPWGEAGRESTRLRHHRLGGVDKF
jgi:hypothetical protein